MHALIQYTSHYVCMCVCVRSGQLDDTIKGEVPRKHNCCKLQCMSTRAYTLGASRMCVRISVALYVCAY